MPKKTKLVQFTSNNARILVNASASEYPDALVNPDLSAVKGVPPHHWKQDKQGRIVPMNPFEKAIRKNTHLKRGVDNDVERFKAPRIFDSALIPGRAFWIGLAAAAAGYASHWLT